MDKLIIGLIIFAVVIIVIVIVVCYTLFWSQKARYTKLLSKYHVAKAVECKDSWSSECLPFKPTTDIEVEYWKVYWALNITSIENKADKYTMIRYTVNIPDYGWDNMKFIALLVRDTNEIVTVGKTE